MIELLGLAGKYVQITRESMPYIRGLASIYGMAFTPGPWIESIQMIKGTGSVVNGFESMTGQINLEFLSQRLLIHCSSIFMQERMEDMRQISM